MKTGNLLGIIGICATFLAGGLALVVLSDNIAKTIGIILIVLCFLIPSIILIYFKLKSFETINKEHRNILDDNLRKFQNTLGLELSSYTNHIEKLIDNAGFENDARFIRNGFIGLQNQVNIIEAPYVIGDKYVRMAVLGHLPSFMRLNDLSDEMGNKLYKNWEPPYLISEYIKLTNQRKSSFSKFLESGGIARDIYFKQDIEDYVRDGCTFHDNIEDPIEEIEERLKALLFNISKPNYWICLLDEKRKSPNYILKQNVGLLIDLRTTEITSHFTRSIDGLYTNSVDIIDEFERKFQLSWQRDHQSNKKEIEKFLRVLLNNLEDFKINRSRKV